MYVDKQDLALNSQEGLIRHKKKQSTIYSMYVGTFGGVTVSKLD